MTCKLALLLGGVTPIIPMILTGMTAPLAPDLKGALMKAKPSSQACAALMVSYHFAIAALERKLVLQELLSGEVLEVWIIDPAFAHAFVGQSVNMLEQKKSDHKLCRNSRPATVAVQRRDLAVDELPVDLA